MPVTLDFRVFFGYIEFMTSAEPITVDALFANGKIQPQTIFVKNRPITIKKIVFSSSRREGVSEIITFSLASETAVYEVEFNKANCQWMLKNIFLDG